MPVFAHIAGFPVEESLAGLGPLLVVTCGWCVATLRARLGSRRREVE